MCVCVCVCVRNESAKKETKYVCVGVYFGGFLPARWLNMEKTFRKQSSKFLMCVCVRNGSEKKEWKYICVCVCVRAQ